jgi:hypothetical protein
MDETKRFIRYIIPGLSIVPQFLLFIYFYDKSKFDVILDAETNSLGLILTAFFATGTIGFLFSNIYYVIHWHLAFKWTKLNYINIVTDEKNAELFEDFYIENLSQYQAGSTMSVCWKMICEKKYPELDQAEKTFGNILHSIGTTILIMITGLVLGSFLLIAHNKALTLSLPWFIGTSIVILFFLCINYRIVANMLQTLWEQSFSKLRVLELKRTKEKKRK